MSRGSYAWCHSPVLHGGSRLAGLCPIFGLLLAGFGVRYAHPLRSEPNSSRRLFTVTARVSAYSRAVRDINRAHRPAVYSVFARRAQLPTECR